jgi:hypothetical protein
VVEVAKAKVRRCPRCGEDFKVAKSEAYIYEGRTPIHRPCEIRRSSQSKKNSKGR